MADRRFEWDPAKAIRNFDKHDIEFEEATSVFGRPETLTVYDEQHSIVEERFVALGYSHKGRLLYVVYTEMGNLIRLISARKAKPREEMDYARYSN